MMAAVSRRLWQVAIAVLVLIASGWLLHRFGFLPSALVPWARPLIAIAVVAVGTAEAIPAGRKLLRAPRLRWSGRVVVAALPLVVAFRVAEHVAGFDSILTGTFGWLTVAFGVALLVDAWQGATSGVLTATGVSACTLAGSGLLLLMGSTLTGDWQPWTAVAGVVTVLVGGIAGSFARRQIQQSAPALNLPNSRVQMEQDLDRLLRQRQRSRS